MHGRKKLGFQGVFCEPDGQKAGVTKIVCEPHGLNAGFFATCTVKMLEILAFFCKKFCLEEIESLLPGLVWNP